MIKQEYWVVKYALSFGIQKVIGRVEGSMLIADDEKGLNRVSMYHGRNKDWCDNIDDAIRLANSMKEKKIESLKKQIQKLEKLDFENYGLEQTP